MFCQLQFINRPEVNNVHTGTGRAKGDSVVSCIPRGRVATYGQIARLAGIPGHARQVGYALSNLGDQVPIPWHRVVNARGMISSRADGSSMAVVQRLLLEDEGVTFDENGRIPLSRFQWLPES